MKKLHVLMMVVTLCICNSLLAATITQSFDTGAITPGLDTVSQFNVNKFDTSLGTLTRVTFDFYVETWDGYYRIENDTNPSVPVSGHSYIGVTASLSGTTVPAGFTSAQAIDTQSFNLANTGDYIEHIGPDSNDRNSSAVQSQNAQTGNFSLYEGAGTYAVDFHSTQSTTHSADGGIDGTFNSAKSQGYLTVTYEYTLVPEPSSLAFLMIGAVLLAVKRRRT